MVLAVFGFNVAPACCCVGPSWAEDGLKMPQHGPNMAAASLKSVNLAHLGLKLRAANKPCGLQCLLLVLGLDMASTLSLDTIIGFVWK